MLTQLSSRAALAWLGAVLIASTSRTLCGQATPSASSAVKVPAYDVVSIKPNKGGSGNSGWDQNDGNFSASNISLKQLLDIAYNLKEGQLVGLPPWGSSARFDIAAKVLEPDKEVFKKLTDAQSAAMLQPMLEERFGLKSHAETKVLPVYELVVVKGGPRVKAATAGNDGSLNIRNREMTASRIPLEALASNLSNQLQRIVIDKTGLAGKYDFTLTWSPDDGPVADSANAPPVLLTALQEQLGLKLVPSKAPIATLVVDHVELPSEN